VGQIRAFQIYDRWGGLVYQAADFPPNDLLNSWDGRLKNGQVAAVGTYVFWAEIESLDGQVLMKKGDIQSFKLT
jgi:hypothetical protein